MAMPNVPSQIRTYGDLKNAVALWADRDDDEFVNQIPNFINFAEKEIYRAVRIPRFEREIYLKITNGMAYIPTDLLQVNYIMKAETGQVFRVTSLEELDWLRRGKTTHGTAFNESEIVWARSTGRFYFYPPITATIPEGTELTGNEVLCSYYRDTSEMKNDSDSCAILTNAPELLLYTALKHAALFVQDDNSVQKWGALAAASMSDIQKQADMAEYSGSPLVIPNSYDSVGRRSAISINYGVDYNE